MTSGKYDHYMDNDVMQRSLEGKMHKHIISGLSTAAHLRRYLKEPLENFAVFEDNLVLGPLLPLTDIDKFILAREKFWKNNLSEDDGFLTYSLREFIEQIKKTDNFTLWVSPGAHDQIFWTWLVSLFDQLNKDFKTVKVKHLFNNDDQKFPYITLGELNPEDFAKCQDFAFEDAQIDFLRNTYDALQSSDPTSLVKICNLDICPLPELQKSLKAYLKLYPDVKSGITICQKALLSECSERQLKSARIVGYAMMYDGYENRLTIGDRFLFQNLINMSQLHSEKPLVNFAGKVKNAQSMRWTEVSITELGQKVLTGEENNVLLNGIDMHIAGVHLNQKTADNLWFYDDGRLLLKR